MSKETFATFIWLRCPCSKGDLLLDGLAVIHQFLGQMTRKICVNLKYVHIKSIFHKHLKKTSALGTEGNLMKSFGGSYYAR